MSGGFIQLAVWLLLAILCAEGARLPRWPTVQYNDRVKFADLTEGQSLPVSRTSANDTLYFRALVFNDDSTELYAGSREVLYLVDPTDMSIREKVEVNSSSPCTTPEENVCHNYVSIIQPLEGDCLFVCGTDSRNPKCYFVNTNDSSLSAADARFSADDGAPAEPYQNISWIYLNGEQKLFRAVGREDLRINSDPNFRSSSLRNCSMTGFVDNDVSSNPSANWLNRPEFVGDIIEHGSFIYFFYREYASEAINGGKIVYSRVGRVCKDDTGGEEFTALQKQFLTFQKARLDCSLTDNGLDFDYNEIQDTYVLDKTIFAVFTTPRFGVASSAVCAYNLDEIIELFEDGRFKGQAADKALWTALPRSDEPPGLFDCANLPSTIPQFEFLLTYPLKNRAVPNKLNYKDDSTNAYTRESDAPLFIVNDVRLSQIVVDEDVNGVDVMFLGTERGTVIKAYLNNITGDANAFLIEEIDFNKEGLPEAPILTMVKKVAQDFIYVGTDNSVYKLPVQSCADKSLCECAKNVDPYCECDGSNCVQKTGVPSMPTPMPCMSDCTTPGAITVVRHEPCSKCYSKRCPDIACTTCVPENKIVYLNFAAYAPEGSKLSATKVKCSCLDEGPDQTVLRSVGHGKEFVTVTAVVNVSTDCNCSIDLTANGGVKELLTTDIYVDKSPVIDDSCCLEENQQYICNISKYKRDIRPWKTKLIKDHGCPDMDGVQQSYMYCEDSDCNIPMGSKSSPEC